MTGEADKEEAGREEMGMGYSSLAWELYSEMMESVRWRGGLSVARSDHRRVLDGDGNMGSEASDPFSPMVDE
jgi:hypothetical protein